MADSQAMPTGTVTMVFTDIEGSTGHLQRLGEERYAAVLDEHHEILARAIDRFDGVTAGIEGDGRFAVFTRPRDALAASLQFQRELTVHEWPDRVPIKVRVGMHTGEVALGNNGYVGFAVHQAARISASGHGGQVVVSEATSLAGQLPEGAAYRDLGEHQLKDMPHLLRLFQLEAEGVAREFPPLRSIASDTLVLPLQLTNLVGRDEDISDVAAKLSGCRLLTIIGSGGAGKTRLAAAVATDVVSRFSGGAWFIDLAPVEGSAVSGQVLRQMKLEEQPGVEVASLVIEYTRPRTSLLVFDNCEHVLDDVVPLIGSLLQECPSLTVLATSREPLGVPGEITWRIPSLAAESAVALFVDRAAAAGHTIDLGQDGDTVRFVCERLDGMPLAIELAAAKTRVLSVRQIADRVDEALTLLTGGSRASLPRQRTLEATIEWSYRLLGHDEGALLRALSVFAGRFDLEAAAAVSEFPDVVEPLLSLVDKSLVHVVDSVTGRRYRLPETIRQFAAARLEEPEVLSRHCLHFVDLAEHLKLEMLSGRRFGDHASQLADESGNFSAALAFAVSGRAGPHVAIRLATSLLWLAQAAGGMADMLRALEAAMEREPDAPTNVLGGALVAAVFAGRWAGLSPIEVLEARNRQALELWRAGGLDDVDGMYALHAAGLDAAAMLDADAAQAAFDEELAFATRLGDDGGMSMALNGLGEVAKIRRDSRLADSRFRASAEAARRSGRRLHEARSLGDLGVVALEAGRLEEAGGYFAEAAIAAQEVDDAFVDVGSRVGRAAVAALADDPDGQVLMFEAEECARRRGDDFAHIYTGDFYCLAYALHDDDHLRALRREVVASRRRTSMLGHAVYAAFEVENGDPSYALEQFEPIVDMLSVGQHDHWILALGVGAAILVSQGRGSDAARVLGAIDQFGWLGGLPIGTATVAVRPRLDSMIRAAAGVAFEAAYAEGQSGGREFVLPMLQAL